MYQFIVNPNAQGGRGIRIWKKLERQLKRACVEFQVYLIGQSGDARMFGLQLTEQNKEPCCIVIVGEEWILTEVLDGLTVSPDITLGYVPVGFTNDFARNIRLPRKPKACLKRIIDPKQIKMVDYGVATFGTQTVEHRRFLTSAGIGSDIALQQRGFSQKTERCLSFLRLKGLVELFRSMKRMVAARPVKGYLILDGVKRVEFNRLYFVTANIHPFTGGGFKLASKANYNNGKLTVCVIHSIARVRLIPICLRARLWNLGKDRGVRFYECREVQVHMEEPRALGIDGVVSCMQTDMHIRCIEKKLRIIR